MVNLLPKESRGKDEVIRIAGVDVGPLSSVTEVEVAYRMDRYLRDRPNLKLSVENLRKAYALALTYCPAVYIDEESLTWTAKPPPVQVLEVAVAKALRRVSALEPRTH